MQEINIEDYGITEKDLQKETYLPESFYGFGGGGIGLIISLTIIIMFFRDHNFNFNEIDSTSFIKGLLSLILFFPFLLIGTIFTGFIIAAIIVSIVSWIDSYFYKKNPLYRAAQQYKIDKRFYETEWEILEEERKRQEYEKALEQKRQERNYWLSMTGKGIKFEREVGKLFSKMGYRVKYTSRTGDEGVDLFLTDHKNEKIVVQCKAHQKPIGPGPIRDLFGTLHHNNVGKAIIVSLSGFSDAAKEFAMGKPINLLTVDDLIKLQKKYLTKTND
jgi:hypothetical protein